MSEECPGWRVDRAPGNIHGWYGYGKDGTPNGYALTDGNASGVDAGSCPNNYSSAKLGDTPSATIRQTLWEAETYAVAKEGKQKGQVYGGISWGFYVDSWGNVYSQDVRFLSSLSGNFAPALAMWNKQADPANKMLQNATGQLALPTDFKNPEVEKK